MEIIPFEELYYMNFTITEPLAKPHNWYERSNNYSCIGKPKPSHTLLWFKNCTGVITSKNGEILKVERNQLVYMAKGLEYNVDFFDTLPEQVDTVVFHFQLHDSQGREIAPTLKPTLCIKNVDVSLAMAIDLAGEEFKKSIACVPEITAVIYSIFSNICKKMRRTIAKNKYAYIRAGIELLENDTDKSMDEIAEICGVSEGYFRRLFREYSGDNPMDFRQKHRIEKAKQMLLLDTFSIGEIAHELGYSDIYHFSKTFKKYCGVSPSDYLKTQN